MEQEERQDGRISELKTMLEMGVINEEEFDKMFEGLPVLFVNDWKDVTQKLLDDTINKFKNMTFNYDKLTLDYWKQIVFSN